MKRIIKAAISVILVVCIVFSQTAAAVILGDIDGDGKIMATDARLVLRAAVELETLTPLQFASADATKDGKITAEDARLVLRAAVGLETLHIHSFSKKETVAEATCKDKGLQNWYCTCGESVMCETDLAAHSYKDGFCTVCQQPEEQEIPRMYFTGNISGMNNKKDERIIDISYVSSNISFSGAAKIKVQGTSSLAYEKKNYTINLYKDSSVKKKLSVDVGWGAQSKYCLKANWIDKTHARNIVTAGIAAKIQNKYGLFEEAPHNGTIDGFPIEIYINGEFLGVYTLNIPKDAWMFSLDESNPDHLVFCGEGWLPANYFKALPDYTTWAAEVGEENEYSMDRLTELFDFIINSTDEEFISEFSKHLNLDSTLNYFLLTEFAFLPDNIGKNMLLVTYDGKIWYPSLYDLDTSWGTHWNGKSVYDYKNEKMDYSNSLLWSRLIELFSEEISERYCELREDILTKEFILKEFRDFQDKIPAESIANEIAKWGTNIPGYDISQIEEYLDYIIPVLDEKYGYDVSENPSTEEETTTVAEETTTEAEETTTVAEETTTEAEETTTKAEETTTVAEETTTE